MQTLRPLAKGAFLAKTDSDESLTEQEIDARREAGLKKLLATPHKPHKPKAAKPPTKKPNVKPAK
jgi:hypothetical protein